MVGGGWGPPVRYWGYGPVCVCSVCVTTTGGEVGGSEGKQRVPVSDPRWGLPFLLSPNNHQGGLEIPREEMSQPHRSSSCLSQVESPCRHPCHPARVSGLHTLHPGHFPKWNTGTRREGKPGQPCMFYALPHLPWRVTMDIHIVKALRSPAAEKHASLCSTQCSPALTVHGVSVQQHLRNTCGEALVWGPDPGVGSAMFSGVVGVVSTHAAPPPPDKAYCHLAASLAPRSPSGVNDLF